MGRSHGGVVPLLRNLVEKNGKEVVEASSQVEKETRTRIDKLSCYDLCKS